MLDLNQVAKNFDTVVARLSARSGTLDLSRFKELFAQRKSLYVELEANQAKKNKAQELMKTDASKRAELGPEMKALGQVIKDMEVRLKAIEDELGPLMMNTPNVPHESVPVGASEHDNECVRTWGELPTFTFTPKQHFEVGEKLGMLDPRLAPGAAGQELPNLPGKECQLS